MITGFDPILAKQPRMMILGSMPSVTSLDKKEYYAYAHNRFWKILHHIYEMPIDTYEQKKQIIYQHQLFLWDVIAQCERIGSLDSAIRDVVVNDIEGMLNKYPTIKLIVCNGRKSYDLYCKHFAHLHVECRYLPSTSNANRSIKETTLYECWEAMLKQTK